MYVRQHTLSLPHPRPPRVVSHMRVRTHTRTATSPSAPSDGPAHCLAYFAFVLLCLRPTFPSSYPCSHALSHIDARPHGPAHSLTRQSIPSRRTSTPSGPDFLPPRHALSLDKYVQAPVPHAHVRAFTIFRTPSLPPLPSPSCPISSRIHAITNTHARTPSCACPTRPACTLALVPQHAPVACLFLVFL